MFPPTNPVMALINVPVPDPLVVLLSVVVGLGVVLQQIPLAVTSAPPMAVTFPPLAAVVAVMAEIAVVVDVGREVEKLTSAP